MLTTACNKPAIALCNTSPQTDAMPAQGASIWHEAEENCFQLSSCSSQNGNACEQVIVCTHQFTSSNQREEEAVLENVHIPVRKVSEG